MKEKSLFCISAFKSYFRFIYSRLLTLATYIFPIFRLRYVFKKKNVNAQITLTSQEGKAYDEFHGDGNRVLDKNWSYKVLAGLYRFQYLLSLTPMNRIYAFLDQIKTFVSDLVIGSHCLIFEFLICNVTQICLVQN